MNAFAETAKLFAPAEYVEIAATVLSVETWDKLVTKLAVVVPFWKELAVITSELVTSGVFVVMTEEDGIE